MEKKHIFAARLKELRKAKGLTQKGLAQSLGVSLSSIINYENEQRYPVAGVISLMSQFFGIDREYLCGETDVKELEPIVTDPDSREITRDNLPRRMNELAALLENGKDAEVELVNHVVSELSHILKMKDKSQRNAALSIMRDVFATTSFFLDVCENCCRDAEAVDRIEFAKEVMRIQVAQALSKSDIFLTK